MVIGVLLLGWWVISPVFWDDGWVAAREQMFASAGVFSNYYDAFGATHPLGYWLEWAHHWLAESTTALLFLRIPALLCLAAMWVLCRWIFRRVAPASSEPRMLWVLASAFGLGALSWGMTLRPEPVVALLVTGVLACVVRFVEREDGAPIAVALVLVALSVCAHPAGVVAASPLLVALPTLFRWVRSNLAAAATIIIACAALFSVLAFAGSDLQQRRDDVEFIRTHPDSASTWRDEPLRYQWMAFEPFGTPLRRASVALIWLAVILYISVRRSLAGTAARIPAAALLVAIGLLIATPSKWPWHFGTLIGILAVAVASQTAILGNQVARSRGHYFNAYAAIGIVVIGAAWSWSSPAHWNELDLVTLDWSSGFASTAGVWITVSTTLVLALVLVVALLDLDFGRAHLHRIACHAASWTVAALAVPLIAFTVGVLLVDSVKSQLWTLSRQNVDTLRGDLGCGLADDTLIATRSSMRPLAARAAAGGAPVPAWVPPAPVAGLPRFTLRPNATDSSQTPWFELRPSAQLGVFVAGTPAPATGLELEWGRFHGSEIKRLGRDTVPTFLGSVSPPSPLSWRFLASGELPPRPPGANAVRLVLRSGAAVASAISVTAPMTYANERLGQRFERPSSRALVVPHLLMYFPCVRQPRLRDGVVEVPSELVALRSSMHPVIGRGISPFEGLLDLYRIEQRALVDSQEQRENIAVYEIDQTIFGAFTAPPDKRTLTS